MNCTLPEPLVYIHSVSPTVSSSHTESSNSQTHTNDNLRHGLRFLSDAPDVCTAENEKAQLICKSPFHFFCVYSLSQSVSDQHSVLHQRADAQRWLMDQCSCRRSWFCSFTVPNDQKWKRPHPLVSSLTVLTLRNLMASWDYSMEMDTPGHVSTAHLLHLWWEMNEGFLFPAVRLLQAAHPQTERMTDGEQSVPSTSCSLCHDFQTFLVFICLLKGGVTNFCALLGVFHQNVMTNAVLAAHTVKSHQSTSILWVLNWC